MREDTYSTFKSKQDDDNLLGMVQKKLNFTFHSLSHVKLSVTGKS